MLPPGLAADVVIFDPAAVNAGKEMVANDFSAGGWRIKDEAIGVHYTVVND